MNTVARTHRIWIALIFLTLITYAIGETDIDGKLGVSIIVCSMFIKSIFVIRDFMELNGVAFIWRAIVYGWLIITCSSIAVSYFLSIPPSSI